MLGLRLDEFLDALAARGPVPAAGAAAAVCAAMAGSLVAMAARTSPDWEESGGVAAQAEALRARVTPLALADSEAYADVLAALASTGGGRRPDLAAALRRASEVPLAIAEAAADTATLAAHAAPRCNASVRGEALVAVVLAEAAARAAARLVEINLAAATHDPHHERARRALDEAAAALRQAAAE
ncbi:MAG: cyclodeaminase/cyclohydrolase family protein [Gaiellaceae bacterium]